MILAENLSKNYQKCVNFQVTWYINGNQALHGHRHKLHYDGIHYLTIQNCRISDAGEVGHAH